MLQNAYMVILGASTLFGMLKLLSLNKRNKALGFYLLFIFLLELTISIFYPRNNTEIYNWFTFIQFLFLFWHYSIWGETSVSRKLGKISLIAYPFLFLFNLIFVQGTNVFHTYTMLVGSTLIALLASFYFYNLITKDNSNKNIIHRSTFWFNTGVLFFYVGSFIYLSILNYLINSNETLAFKIFPLINILNIVYYGLFSFVFKFNSDD